MHAIAAAGAGFLLAVLWFDLMFDVQVRKAGRDAIPAGALASISAYYRRVTTEARPMSSLIPVVMLVVVAAVVAGIATGAAPAWVGWVSLAAALCAIGLAMARTVPNARRMGRETEPVEDQSRLARSIYRDHQICFLAMLTVLALQLYAANTGL